MRKFVRSIPMKLYVLLAALVIFAFFSNDFGLVDIQKTAIILAAGIDKTENGFSVTAQIAVPKGSDRTTGGTSSVEIEADGATVSDCFQNIHSKTGWVPKLVFCDLILIGEEAAKEDVISYLNYFLRNEYMPDSCLLAVCTGKAGEMISSQSAIDDASSLAIEKIFSESSVKAGVVLPNTLKDFAIGYYGVSKSGYLPYVRSTPQQGEQSGQTQTAAGGSGKSAGSSSEEQVIYSAEETALFLEGKMVALLPADQTRAFSLLKGNVFSGNIPSDDNGKAIALTVLENSGGISMTIDKTPKVKLGLDLKVRLCCRGVTSPIEEISSDVVPPETLEKAKTALEQDVRKLWEICKESGCDLFELKKSLYRSSLKKFSEWKDTLLSAVEAEIETDIVSVT